MISSGIDWTAGSHEELCRRHRWTIPARLNVARAACDAHAGSGRTALIEVADSGDGFVRREHGFSELAERSGRLAGGFAALGVNHGDRVAVFLPQRVECALAHLATFAFLASDEASFITGQVISVSGGLTMNG